MRAIFLLLIISSFGLLSCSTNRSVSKAFSKYSDEEGVTAISIPGWVLRVGAGLSDLEPEERAFLKKTDKVKVLVVENPSLNQTVNFHDEFLPSITKGQKFEELIKVRDNGDDVSILSNMTGETIRELIVLVSGDENIIVYVKGDFDAEMIKNLVKENSDDLLKDI